MNTPEEIHGVSQTQLSVARYYGGCRLNGAEYVYDYSRDVLIRADVLKRRQAEEKKAKQQRKKVAKEKQGELFGDVK